MCGRHSTTLIYCVTCSLTLHSDVAISLFAQEQFLKTLARELSGSGAKAIVNQMQRLHSFLVRV